MQDSLAPGLNPA